VKDVHKHRLNVDQERSPNHEQDLLGAIFREHDPVGALSERGSSGSPPAARDHQSLVQVDSGRQEGTHAVETASRGNLEGDVNALLVKGSKKNKKSHARKQPKGHIPRPRNA